MEDKKSCGFKRHEQCRFAGLKFTFGGVECCCKEYCEYMLPKNTQAKEPTNE